MPNGEDITKNNDISKTNELTESKNELAKTSRFFRNPSEGVEHERNDYQDKTKVAIECVIKEQEKLYEELNAISTHLSASSWILGILTSNEIPKDKKQIIVRTLIDIYEEGNSITEGIKWIKTLLQDQ